MADQSIGNAVRGDTRNQPFTSSYGISESIRAGAPVNLGTDGKARHASAASDATTRWPTIGLAKHGATFGTFGDNGGNFLPVQFGDSLELTDDEVDEVNDDGPVFLVGHFYYVSDSAPGLLTATPPTGGAAVTPVGIAETTNRILILLGAPIAST